MSNQTRDNTHPVDEGTLHRTQPPLPAGPDRAAIQPPSAPASKRWGPRRAASLAGGLVGVALLLVLGSVAWLTFAGLAQQQEKPGLVTPTVGSVTAASIPSVVSTASAVDTGQPVEEATFLFSLPVGKDGVTYAHEIYFGYVAVANDGTFWVTGGENRLLHYSGGGVLLGTIAAPGEGNPIDIVTDGNDLWVLYLSEPGQTGLVTLYKVAHDGRKLAEYEFTSEVLTGWHSFGLVIGENGEVLLKGSFDGDRLAALPTLTAVAPVVPNPVPSVVPGVYPKPLLQLIDSQGNPAPRGLDGYSYRGKLYTARPSSGVHIKAGDVEFTIPLTRGFESVEILGVAPDGSLYVYIVEWDDTSGPYNQLFRTIYHHTADGRLIERVRLLEMTTKVLTRPDGQFYMLVENPLWIQRSGAPPAGIDVYRLNFVPADQPLPPLPTAPPAVPIWTPVPSPTPSPTPTPTPLPCVAGWSVVPAMYWGMLNDIVALSAGEAWAVGTMPTMDDAIRYGVSFSLILHRSGAVWVRVDSPNADSGENVLHAVDAISSDDVWVLGTSGPRPEPSAGMSPQRPVVLHWNGSGWSVVNITMLPQQAQLNAVKVIGPNDVWIVGTQSDANGTYTLAMHWDGSHWSKVPTPNPSKLRNNLQAITAISPNDIWAVGEHYDPALETGPSSPPLDRTFALHWDGRQWSQVPTPNVPDLGNRLADVAALSANDVWAAGSTWGGDSNGPLAMRWDGREWALMPGPQGLPGEDMGLVTLAVLSSDDIWTAGEGYLHHWNGTRWTTSQLPRGPGQPKASGPNAISVSPDGHWWAVGSGPTLDYSRAGCATPTP